MSVVYPRGICMFRRALIHRSNVWSHFRTTLTAASKRSLLFAGDRRLSLTEHMLFDETDVVCKMLL